MDGAVIAMIVVLVVAATLSHPAWRHSRSWGYLPVSVFSLAAAVLLFTLILAS